MDIPCKPKNKENMLSHDCQIRVWYKHTDQMAICHHSNYICYYEAARSEFLRALGMSFAEVERRGIMMPILEVQSKYRKPAYFDELLTVRIILREMPRHASISSTKSTTSGATCSIRA